jgi:SET domain-containing protein
MSLQQVPGLYVAETEHRGRGMFCAEDIQKGTLIEICPLIKIPKNQLQTIDQTILYNYYFLLDEEEYPACIALGYGSMYNHAETPNAEVLMDANAKIMYVECIQTINAGDEILISYSNTRKETNNLWFNPK